MKKFYSYDAICHIPYQNVNTSNKVYVNLKRTIFKRRIPGINQSIYRSPESEKNTTTSYSSGKLLHRNIPHISKRVSATNALSHL